MKPRTPLLPLQALLKSCPDATTRWKVRFYCAVDTRGDTPLKDVFLSENVPADIGYCWLRKRRFIGSPATRRTGKYRSGRPVKIQDSQLTQLLDTSNPVRNQRYEI